MSGRATWFNINTGQKQQIENTFSKIEKVEKQWLRGRNNGWSMVMTSQILPFVHPEFSVITEMISHFFLEQLEKAS